MKIRTLLFIALLVISGLAKGQNSINYYGSSPEGGTDDLGCIFKTDSTGGNIQTVYNFTFTNPGENPSGKLVKASNGLYYGVSRYGGTHYSATYGGQKSAGYIFSYNITTNTYTIVHEFDIANGKWPNRGMLLASNGTFYGATKEGGTYGKGVLYSFNPSTTVFTILHHFHYTSSYKDGEKPTGYLIQAGNGKIYGSTEEGGSNHYYGTLFSYNPSSSTYGIEASFASGSAGGGYSPGGLVIDSDGNIYGMASQAAANFKGSIFRYNPSSHVLTMRKAFSTATGTNGYLPMNVVGTDSIYGVINSGDWNDYHYNIFLYRPSLDSIRVIDTLRTTSLNEMVIAPNGKFYGAIRYANNIYGGLYEFDYSTANATRIFQNTQSLNGRHYNSPIILPNGNLLGLTGGGGHGEAGIIYQYNPTNNMFTKLLDFNNPVQGRQPIGGMIMAENGLLYGITKSGGANDYGVVFELNPQNNQFTVRANLDSLKGYDVCGGLMQASNGKFYYTTNKGGANYKGALVEVNPNGWTVTKKVDFSNSLGTNPKGKLMQASNGKLYGFASNGGANNYGSIFEYDINTGSCTNKYSFVSTSNVGFSAYGSLTEANDGYLYFITGNDFYSYYSHGSISRFDPQTASVTFRKSLFSYSGYYDSGNTFIKGINGHLYATITDGGSNSEGTLIKYDVVNNTISVLINLTQANGSNPTGRLMQASNDKFYGMTSLGGTNSYGTIFSYDDMTGTYAKKYNFDLTHGSHPAKYSLVEICSSNISINTQPTIGSHCDGDSTYLYISATHCSRLSYQWYKNGVKLMGETNDSLYFTGLNPATDNGSYYCKVKGSAATVTSNTYNLVVNPLPAVALSGLNPHYCAGDATVNLSGLPTGGSFSGTNVNGSIFSPINSGTYYISYSYTDAQGCSATDVDTSIVFSLPNASFTGLASSYCNNGLSSSLIPTVSGGSFSGYAMTANTFDPSVYVFGGGQLLISSKVKYTVSDINGCTNSDSATTIIYPIPNVSISGLDSIYCSNDAIDTLITSPSGGVLTAGNGFSNNIFDPSVAIMGLNSVYYSYTNSNNCTNADTFTLVVNAAPDASFIGLSSSYCHNSNTVTITPNTNGGQFSGNGISGNTFDPSLINIPAGSLAAFTKVFYSLTNAAGCSSEDSTTLTIYPLPTVSFGSLDSSFCNNDIPLLLNTGSPSGGNYSGNGITGMTFTPSLANIGLNNLVYSYTNSNNCTNWDTATTIVYAAPNFALPADSEICINHTITISTGLGAGYVYLWSNNSTDSTITIDASALGIGIYNYSVTVTSPQGNCQQTDDVIITINPCTGIDNITKTNDNIWVYPNPSNGLININSDVDIDAVEIYTTQGKLIYQRNITEDKQGLQIDIQGVAQGIYYLLLSNRDSIFRKKILIGVHP